MGISLGAHGDCAGFGASAVSRITQLSQGGVLDNDGYPPNLDFRIRVKAIVYGYVVAQFFLLVQSGILLQSLFYIKY